MTDPTSYLYVTPQVPFWQRFWDLFYPHKRYPPRDVPIVATLFYLSLTVFIARTLRWLVVRFFPVNLQSYAHNFINAWQGCACSLENSITKRYYGKVAYAVQSFIMAIWFQWTWPAATSGNPCGNWMNFIEGKARFFSTLCKMSLQMIGGLCAYRYARFFWYLELCNGHAQRYSMIECFSDLTVAVPMGFMLEFSASFVDKLVGKTTLLNLEKFEQFFRAVVGITITLAGIHLTGMYFNPANATQQTFGCHGTSGAEHIFVYWVGPLLGCSVAVKVHLQLMGLWKSKGPESHSEKHEKAQNKTSEKRKEDNGNIGEVNHVQQDNPHLGNGINGNGQLSKKTN